VLFYLLILGIAIPAVELVLLVLISESIGFWSTLGLIIGTGTVGAVLWRWQGFGVFGRLRRGIGKGSSPGDALLDGAMIFFAGGLLLTPGVLTDLVGFMLLIPWTRLRLKSLIKQWLKTKFQLVDVTSQMRGSMPFQPFGNAYRGGDSGPGDAGPGDDDFEPEIMDGNVVEGYLKDKH
jgi:UPF0716 protein FxsA